MAADILEAPRGPRNGGWGDRDYNVTETVCLVY